MNRRVLIVGAIGAIAVGSIAWSEATKLPFKGDAISPSQAHEYATSGQIVLIDIRRPDEWNKTGSGQGASRLDMRRQDFITELDKIVGGDRSKPVALICARGVRSNRMSQHLINAGYTNIIDVPEGMLGSQAGPGWLKRGLPVVH
ncbi:rhodanese-like domain-containing protein [Amylibacter sp. SFDW26]|uniref:rhodanese-like domain-containing protein n=1 Tax=Amylibacter sp. SFDW26 TaxID=2652722 RepID=UPI001D032CDD|nr:rhodanese-like domain-containing protein [Amylibacter sp. SFDW26]